eukprot:scaffold43986_cov59-Phaeocystis_antarctica.AAC.3
MQASGCNWNRRSGPSSVSASPGSSSHRLTKPERREAPSLHRTTVPHAARMRVSLPLDRRTRECPTVTSAVSSIVDASLVGSILLRCGENWCAASSREVDERCGALGGPTKASAASRKFRGKEGR